uniref:Uncharacterized protein n=1 Tax=Anguilla anguilla TaxID=7936 RepID=A0A0E9XVC0_ANGAN
MKLQQWSHSANHHSSFHTRAPAHKNCCSFNIAPCWQLAVLTHTAPSKFTVELLMGVIFVIEQNEQLFSLDLGWPRTLFSAEIECPYGGKNIGNLPREPMAEETSGMAKKNTSINIYSL